MLERVGSFADLLETEPDGPAFARLRGGQTTGRPVAPPGMRGQVK
jgi:hypothetical protein